MTEKLLKREITAFDREITQKINCSFLPRNYSEEKLQLLTEKLLRREIAAFDREITQKRITAFYREITQKRITAFDRAITHKRNSSCSQRNFSEKK